MDENTNKPQDPQGSQTPGTSQPVGTDQGGQTTPSTGQADTPVAPSSQPPTSMPEVPETPSSPQGQAATGDAPIMEPMGGEPQETPSPAPQVVEEKEEKEEEGGMGGQ